MPSVDWKTIHKKLREQGWRLETTTKGHTKAFPADPTQRLVVLSDSGDHRAIHNSLRELRASGFVWDEAPASRRVRAVAAGQDFEPEAVTQPDAAVVEASASRILTASEVTVALAPIVRDPDLELDAAYASLRDARQTVQLLRMDRVDALRRLEEAQEHARRVDSALAEASSTLARRKAEFDRLAELREEEP